MTCLETTTYHVDCHGNRRPSSQAQTALRARAPSAAWTAIDVDRLAPGAGGIVEIRVIASRRGSWTGRRRRDKEAVVHTTGGCSCPATGRARPKPRRCIFHRPAGRAQSCRRRRQSRRRLDPRPARRAHPGEHLIAVDRISPAHARGLGLAGPVGRAPVAPVLTAGGRGRRALERRGHRRRIFVEARIARAAAPGRRAPSPPPTSPASVRQIESARR